MVRWAAAYHGPVYIRTGRMPFPVLFPEDHRFELGQGHILREGEDVTLAGVGLMVHHCLEAAAQLAADGVSARVLNLASLKPLDWQLVVDSARRTKALVTAEEHLVTGGLGSAVSEVLAEHYPAALRRVGLRDIFGASGKPEDLLRHYGLMPGDIRTAALEVIKRRKD
jgi:transketolase